VDRQTIGQQGNDISSVKHWHREDRLRASKTQVSGICFRVALVGHIQVGRPSHSGTKFREVVAKMRGRPKGFVFEVPELPFIRREAGGRHSPIKYPSQTFPASIAGIETRVSHGLKMNFSSTR